MGVRVTRGRRSKLSFTQNNVFLRLLSESDIMISFPKLVAFKLSKHATFARYMQLEMLHYDLLVLKIPNCPPLICVKPCPTSLHTATLTPLSIA